MISIKSSKNREFCCFNPRGILQRQRTASEVFVAPHSHLHATSEGLRPEQSSCGKGVNYFTTQHKLSVAAWVQENVLQGHSTVTVRSKASVFCNVIYWTWWYPFLKQMKGFICLGQSLYSWSKLPPQCPSHDKIWKFECTRFELYWYSLLYILQPFCYIYISTNFCTLS